MGKNPAFQFYPGDWQRDLGEHPLEIEGAWIRICCRLWWSETPGRLTREISQWAKVLNCHGNKARFIINYLSEHRIAEVDFSSKSSRFLLDFSSIRPRNDREKEDDPGLITITSRRMVRDHQVRCIRSKSGTLGGNPSFEKGKPNPYYPKDNTTKKITTKDKQKITPSSSSSSSTTKNNTKKGNNAPFQLPSKEEVTEASPIKTNNDLDQISKQLFNENIFREVYAFKNKMLKDKKNEKAVLHALCRCFLEKPKEPWPYCKKIVDTESGNYNEKDHSRTS
jgi:hypothetical protein